MENTDTKVTAMSDEQKNHQEIFKAQENTRIFKMLKPDLNKRFYQWVDNEAIRVLESRYAVYLAINSDTQQSLLISRYCQVNCELTAA